MPTYFGGIRKLALAFERRTSDNGATRLVRLLNIGIRSTTVRTSLCVVVVDSGSAFVVLLLFSSDVGQR